MNRDNYKYISSTKDIPQTPHFAVLVEESIYYDAGYGDRVTSAHQTLQYIAFTDEHALNDWILEETKSSYNRKKYSVVYINPVNVQLNTTVSIVKS